MGWARLFYTPKRLSAFSSLTGGFFRALFWLGSLAGGFFRVLFWFSCSSLERENLHLLAAGCGYVPSRDRWSRPKKGNSCRASMRKASKLRTRNTLRTGGVQHTSRRRTLHHPTVDAISRNCTSAPELHITPTSIPQVTLDFVGRCRKRRNLAKTRGRHCSRHGLLPFDAALMRLGSDSGR